MNNIIDLHIHSTASDGTVPPKEVLARSLKKNLKYISLTDHESTEGYKELLKIKKEWQDKIEIIPGVELHTYYKGREIHLLGYFIDIFDDVFENNLKKLREARTEIAYHTVEKINKAGINLDWNIIMDTFQGDVAITKGHIIRTIRKLNIEFTRENFYKFFNVQGESYVPFTGNSLEDAIDMIRNNGGIPILAHPGLIRNYDIVEEIISKYHIGVEVFYHYFGDEAKTWVNKCQNIAQKYKVLMTGGSDYHGSITNVEIGDTYVPENIIKVLFENKN